MKIRIDPHLERFEVISQLKTLIVEYNKSRLEGEHEDPKYSFYDYLYQRSIDPVRKFLYLCISQDSFSEDADYDTMINYYSEKFQTFRGTTNIFEYLKSISGILGVTINGYRYTVEKLEVDFGEVKTTDINLFVKMAEDFFKALLYYQELSDTYEKFRLDIISEISVNLSAGSSFYSSYTVEEDNEI